MEKETSTTAGTSLVARDKRSSNSSEGAAKASESTITAADLAAFAKTSALHDLEHRLEQKIAKQSSGKGGLAVLWLIALLGLGAGGYSGYVTLQNQQSLAVKSERDAQIQQKIDAATQSVERSAQQLADAQQRNAEAQQRNDSLLQQNSSLVQAYNNVNQNVAELKSAQAEQMSAVEALNDKVDVFSERNPNDWKLAESYFLVNNASAKAVFEQDVKAAVWMLTQADELLIGMEDEEVVALRQAISRDIATLSNIKLVDMRGLGMTLDRAYDNVDSLVLEGYSDPKKRAAAFEKKVETTSDIADWKENLLNSANDFASRFIEVRRRDAAAATEFLTPAQDLYLRENIKTRILLAKSDLSHGDKDSMQRNLQDAIKLIQVYFDPESGNTASTLEMLSKVEQSEITIAVPSVLSSSNAFGKFAQSHLLGRGQ